MCTNQYYKWHGTHVIFPFSHIDKERNNKEEVQNNPRLPLPPPLRVEFSSRPNWNNCKITMCLLALEKCMPTWSFFQVLANAGVFCFAIYTSSSSCHFFIFFYFTFENERMREGQRSKK